MVVVAHVILEGIILRLSDTFFLEHSFIVKSWRLGIGVVGWRPMCKENTIGSLC